MNIDVTKIRSQFPILQNKIVLSSCSQSALSMDVLNAMDEYKQSLLDYGMAWDLWMEKVENAKTQFAKLIKCEVDEVAILSSVSDSISSILHSLDLKNNDEICLTELDFPCVGHAVLAQQRKKSFGIKFVPHEQYIIPLDHYDKLISHKTKLVCIPHVSYYNGFKQDIKAISNVVHQNDALLFVDAYQSAGSLDINVEEMGIDILVTGMQKYLLGVPGISFLYIKRDIAERLEPSTTGWFGQEKPFDFNLSELHYAKSAQRFNTGTPPVINAYVAEAALKMINSVGIKNIESYLEDLSSYVLQLAEELGLQLMSPTSITTKGPNTAFFVEDAHIVESSMKDAGFIVSARKDVIRIAPHIYNTRDDLKLALLSLKNILTP